MDVRHADEYKAEQGGEGAGRGVWHPGESLPEGCHLDELTRTGTVVAVEGDVAVIRLRPPAGCGQGAACERCAFLRAADLTLRVPRDGLEQGEAVRVSTPSGAATVGILVVYVLPLVLIVLGLVVGALVGGGHVGVEALAGGAVGFALAVGIALLANRHLARRGLRRIERIGPPKD